MFRCIYFHQQCSTRFLVYVFQRTLQACDTRLYTFAWLPHERLSASPPKASCQALLAAPFFSPARTRMMTGTINFDILGISSRGKRSGFQPHDRNQGIQTIDGGAPALPPSHETLGYPDHSALAHRRKAGCGNPSAPHSRPGKLEPNRGCPCAYATRTPSDQIRPQPRARTASSTGIC